MAEDSNQEKNTKPDFQEDLQILDEDLLYVEQLSEKKEKLQENINEVEDVDYSPLVEKAEQEKVDLNEVKTKISKASTYEEIVGIVKSNTNVLNEVRDAEEEYNESLYDLNRLRRESPEVNQRDPMSVFNQQLTRSPEDYQKSLNELADAFGRQFENVYGESVESALGKDTEPFVAEEEDMASLEKSVDSAISSIDEKLEGITGENRGVDITNILNEESPIQQEIPILPEEGLSSLEKSVETAITGIGNTLDEIGGATKENTEAPVEKETIEKTTVIERPIDEEKEVVQKEEQATPPPVTKEEVNTAIDNKIIEKTKETTTERIEENESLVQVEKETAPLTEIDMPDINSEMMTKISQTLQQLPNMLGASLAESIKNIDLPKENKKEIIKNNESNMTLVEKEKTAPAETNEEDTHDLLKNIANYMLSLDHRMRLIHSTLQSPLEVKIKNY